MLQLCRHESASKQFNMLVDARLLSLCFACFHALQRQLSDLRLVDKVHDLCSVGNVVFVWTSIACTVVEFDVMLILSIDLWQTVILSLPLRNCVKLR